MRVGGGCHAACFLRAYAGAPVTRTLRPSLLRCGERPCDTLRALPENTAHQPKHSATMQHTKPRQPSPCPLPHAKHQPPRNTSKRDSPPRPSSLGTGRTQNPRASTATPAGPQRTPNTDTRRGAYILCRDIRVSELCEDGSPAGAKRIYAPRTTKPYFKGNAKIPPIPKNQRDFL